jgi:hypothetical protein
MTYGPIDFIALEFKGNKLKGEVFASLLELVEKKILRVIDLVVVFKDENGEVFVREMQDLEEDHLIIFDPLEVEVTGMLTEGDIEMVSDELANNTAAAIMLFENLWAVKFKEAIIKADGRLLMQQRIPHEVVLEALVDLANFDESA